MILRRRALQPGETDHELIWTCVGLTSAVLSAAWLLVLGPPPIGCTFHAMTGWPCPTCGATRAALAILHGEIGAAMRLNPIAALALLLFPAYVVYGVSVVLFGCRRLRVELTPRDRRVGRAVSLIAIAATWVFLIADGR